jgi:hypothetical protein
MILGFNLASTSAYAEIIYATCGGSEMISHWDYKLNQSASNCGNTPSSVFSYNSILSNGASFLAYASASAEFGQLKLYASFSAQDMPAGSNVTLYDNQNVLRWVNVPVSANATLRDTVRINGPLSSYDLVLPISLEGGFGTSSAPPIGPLDTGIVGDFDLFVRASIGTSVLAYNYLRLNTDQGLIPGNYHPGTYYFTLPGLPANTDFNLRFYANVAFNLLDQVQFSNQFNPDLDFPENITIDGSKTINYRTVPYSVSGTADFSQTISFGSYLAYSNGVLQNDATLTSDNGVIYQQAPEPCTLALLGSGLGLIGMVAWRRRK